MLAWDGKTLFFSQLKFLRKFLAFLPVANSTPKAVVFDGLLRKSSSQENSLFQEQPYTGIPGFLRVCAWNEIQQSDSGTGFWVQHSPLWLNSLHFKLVRELGIASIPPFCDRSALASSFCPAWVPFLTSSNDGWKYKPNKYFTFQFAFWRWYSISANSNPN